MFSPDLIHTTFFLLQIVNEAAKFRYRSGNEFNCGGISFSLCLVLLPFEESDKLLYVSCWAFNFNVHLL